MLPSLSPTLALHFFIIHPHCSQNISSHHTAGLQYMHMPCELMPQIIHFSISAVLVLPPPHHHLCPAQLPLSTWHLALYTSPAMHQKLYHLPHAKMPVELQNQHLTRRSSNRKRKQKFLNHRHHQRAAAALQILFLPCQTQNLKTHGNQAFLPFSA